MIPGVIDLNLDEKTDEELADLVEAARRELAARQTKGAIARDLTDAVDRVIAPNLNLMGEGWEHERVVWDGDAVTITALSPEEYLDLDFPEPEPDEPEAPEVSVRDWAAGMSVSVGDRILYEDAVYEARQSHVTQGGWLPTQLPALYLRIEG